jgi:hypothetical protein
MMGSVTPPPTDGSCTCCPVSATIDKDGALTVTAPVGIYFAVRLFGGAGIDLPASPGFAKTTNCSSQIYTVNATQEGQGYRFHPETHGPEQKLTFATVAWTDGQSGPGMYVVNATLL